MTNNQEPEAYQIGSVPFIHSEIYLDSRPLIPRTETEYWVDLAIKEIKESGIENPRILDLCAGSGCIGVAVLKEIPSARVDFGEIDGRHHETIRKNIEINGIDGARACIFGGNLFENIKGEYDFILSNPPYINPELKDRVEESVSLYEPEIALYGGKDGTEIIENMLNGLNQHLTQKGVLYLEHEPEQVGYLSSKIGYFDTREDQFGRKRFSRFQRAI
jgi:HemK-like putative methylase